MYYDKKVAALEAVLFAAGEPVAVSELADILQMDKPQVWELLSSLSQRCSAEDRGLMLREVAGGYQLVTKPEYYDMLSGLSRKKEVRLSNAAMETLSIIAFKQPVTRSEIEAIRGVKADGVVSTLLELELVEDRGRKKVPGNPILYGTTEKFLNVFGLNSLKDLPVTEEDGEVGETEPDSVQQTLEME